MPVHGNVHIKGHSEHNHLTLYKSLLPGNLPSNYTEYKYLSFTAKGSGLLELGLVKSSIEEWKKQYRANINVKKKNRPIMYRLTSLPHLEPIHLLLQMI